MSYQKAKECVEEIFGSKGKWVTPFMEGDDKLIVLEIGDECHANQGFSRALAWVQHHFSCGIR